MHSDLAKLQHSPQEIARWQKAQQQALSGRHGPAIASYRDLLKRFPGVAQLWFESGIAAAGELDFSKADEAFRRVMELAAKDATMLILTGQQYHRLRRGWTKRATVSERAVAADPNSISAQYHTLRNGSSGNADWTMPGFALRNAMTRHPQDGQTRYFRAFLLHRKGLNSEAETALRDLIKSGPRDPNVRCSSRHLLGVVLDALGQYVEATQWLCGSQGPGPADEGHGIAGKGL